MHLCSKIMASLTTASLERDVAAANGVKILDEKDFAKLMECSILLKIINLFLKILNFISLPFSLFLILFITCII